MGEVRRPSPVLLSFLFTLTNAHLLLSQADYATPILAGISGQGQNQDQPYVTAGDRTYLIGTQDGNFPDMGDHVPGEMGGLWLHPIKLIDGFEAKEKGWSFVLKGKELPGAKYYLNGRPVSFTSSGIRLSGRKNHVLVVQ